MFACSDLAVETAEIIVGVSGFLECDSDITEEPESPAVVLHARIGLNEI